MLEKGKLNIAIDFDEDGVEGMVMTVPTSAVWLCEKCEDYHIRLVPGGLTLGSTLKAVAAYAGCFISLIEHLTKKNEEEEQHHGKI